MATYKVLQDIEAEDKLLGPLTLKQFIFAALTMLIGFVEFKLVTLTGLGVLRWPVVAVLLPPMLILGFLAAPISREQSNDIWLLARLRFLIKPHKRIWDQDGIRELVSINVPKKLEEYLSDGLSQNEVKSRLSALANTLDSRGWAVKNVDVNLYNQQGYSATTTDRLVNPSSLVSDAAVVDIHAADDILDAESNPVAQQLGQMVKASSASHLNKVMQSVQQGAQNQAQAAQAPTDYWFMNQPQTSAPVPAGYSDFKPNPVVQPGVSPVATAKSTAEEEAIIAAQLRAKHDDADNYASHLKNVMPLHKLKPEQTQVSTLIPQASNTANNKGQSGTNPAILGLASNDDLNVETLARQAKEMTKSSDDEVVISLH